MRTTQLAGRTPAAYLRAILVCASLLLTSGCEAMVPYHWDSEELDGETTLLTLDTVPAADAQVLTVTVPSDGTRSGVQMDPRVIENRLSKLTARVASTSSRPPFSWGARTAADFYAEQPRVLGPADALPGSVRLEVKPAVRGFKVTRRLKGEMATEIEFSIEPAEDAFRVTLERITVVYSRAKVADKSWMNFWTRIPLIYGFYFDIMRLFGVEYGDNAVDMQIDIGFNSSWTDAHGETHLAPIAVLGWTAFDMTLGGGPQEIHESSGWLPLPPPSVRESGAAGPTFGRGHFAMWAFITEQDALTQDFLGERRSVGEYFSEILGLLPLPIPVP